ncbi:hypothetical protein THAOC_31423, partial [Thalassiosira oceanica]
RSIGKEVKSMHGPPLPLPCPTWDRAFVFDKARSSHSGISADARVATIDLALSNKGQSVSQSSGGHTGAISGLNLNPGLGTWDWDQAFRDSGPLPGCPGSILLFFCGQVIPICTGGWFGKINEDFNSVISSSNGLHTRSSGGRPRPENLAARQQ